MDTFHRVACVNVSTLGFLGCCWFSVFMAHTFGERVFTFVAAIAAGMWPWYHDWFRFWLQREQDSHPDKRGQYSRWQRFLSDKKAELSR